MQKRVLFISVFIALFSFVLFSCAGGGSAGSEYSESTGLSVTLPGGGSRAVRWTESEIASYTVTISSSSYRESKTCNPGNSVTFEEIPVGTYDVVAMGKTSSGIVAAEGSSSVEIIENEMSNCTIVLSLLVKSDFSGSSADFIAWLDTNPTSSSSSPVIAIITSVSDFSAMVEAISSHTVYVDLDLSDCGLTEFPNDHPFQSNYSGQMDLGDYLKGITLPSGLTTIPKSAFWAGCGFTSITIPASVTRIYRRAFYACGNNMLTSIILEDSSSTWILSSDSNETFNSSSDLLTILAGNDYINDNTYWEKQ
ncbi:MAG: leucine-rich repeat domain-containing protein [Treponema sp.]|nr:leucine-rich repeat domain-containing protein [Treponema sp.]